MNKQLFEDYLFQPNDMPASSVAELKQIIAEYPYFQTAHLLYIKSLHLNNSILYAAHLKQAACYANDRTLLFKLIKGQHAAVRHHVVEVPEVGGEEIEIESITEAVDETVAEEIVPAEVPDPQPVEQLSERILRRLREIEQEHAQHEQSSATIAPVLPQIQPPIAEPDDDDMLSFDDDDDELPPLTSEPHIPQQKRIPLGKFTPQTIEYIHNLERKLAESGSDYFSDVDDTRSDKTHDKLIDAFLTKKPRIIPKKPTQNEEIEDISTKSVEEPEIMTETIAKIYLNQEQFEKALKIYETLSLKYPQKSVYFADKISQTKELIKKSKKI